MVKQNYIIGVDIGGTHTDAVLVDEKQTIICHVKEATTRPLEIGFGRALQGLLQKSGLALLQIAAIKIGTTHATNALLQAEDLLKIGVVRLAAVDPLIPVGFGFPETLKKAVLAGAVCVPGGYECDGRESLVLDEKKLAAAFARLEACGAEGIVVAGVFSPLYPHQEERVRALCPEGIPLCLSSEISGMGFIERENSAIVNLALRKAMQQGFHQLEAKAQEWGCRCPVFLTQNNGSIIAFAEALRHPITTLSAGQTNSFIGGAKLAACSDAVVVDIGGTSADIGVIRSGFPRQSLSHVDIGGISVNVAAPDVHSLPLGGGSIITPGSIGPKSVGRNLKREAYCFGGSTLTLTDVMLARGCAHLPGADVTRIPLDSTQAKRIAAHAAQQLAHAIAKAKMACLSDSVILVGGGSLLFQDVLPESCITLPPFAEVANAYGAALAEVSHTLDVTIEGEDRERQIEEVEERALQTAVAKGASKSDVRIVAKEMMPYHYMPGLRARIVVTAAGSHTL